MPTTFQKINNLPTNIQTILKRPELYKTNSELIVFGTEDPLEIPLDKVENLDTPDGNIFGYKTQPIIQSILGGKEGEQKIDGLHQLVQFARKKKIYEKTEKDWFGTSMQVYTGNQVCEQWDKKYNKSSICKRKEEKCCENIKKQL